MSSPSTQASKHVRHLSTENTQENISQGLIVSLLLSLLLSSLLSLLLLFSRLGLVYLSSYTVINYNYGC